MIGMVRVGMVCVRIARKNKLGWRKNRQLFWRKRRKEKWGWNFSGKELKNRAVERVPNDGKEKEERIVHSDSQEEIFVDLAAARTGNNTCYPCRRNENNKIVFETIFDTGVLLKSTLNIFCASLGIFRFHELDWNYAQNMPDNP